jgi:branched-chain amino acid transport system permease protein
MDTVVLLMVTGLSVGALYFLLASGLGLVFGLMRVLSFAHGAYLSVCAFGGWLVLRSAPLAVGAATGRYVAALAISMVVGAALALLTEVLLIRPLYGRDPLDQLLVTLGLAFVLVAILAGTWGPDEQSVPLPRWVRDTTTVGGVNLPNDRFLLMGVAALVFVGMQLFLRRTRHGLIVRAGVQNRDMVRALGIDVRTSFTLVFTLGGAAAGLGGALAATYSRAVTPHIGDTFLLYAFIVLIVGGLGSLSGAFVAAMTIGVAQQFANYYVDPGSGDVLAVALMALMLLARPEGLFGKRERVV